MIEKIYTKPKWFWFIPIIGFWIYYFTIKNALEKDQLKKQQFTIVGTEQIRKNMLFAVLSIFTSFLLFNTSWFYDKKTYQETARRFGW